MKDESRGQMRRRSCLRRRTNLLDGLAILNSLFAIHDLP